MAQVLIILDDKSQIQSVESGVNILKDFGISFNLRMASSFETPDLLNELISTHQGEGGKFIICVSSNVNHLAGFVAAHAVLPVIAVSLDEEQSMIKSAIGFPIATMPCGASGFTQSAFFLAQTIGSFEAEMGNKVKQGRHSRMAELVEVDDDSRMDFFPD